MSNVSAVTFDNKNGARLFGTLHTPELANPRLPAVVLFSAGVKMRMGPNRLYVPLTEMLTSLGYTVFRFDYYGLGDSEGELQETMLADVYNGIEVGRHVDDARSALEWLRTHCGFERFVVGGLCGGAITALLTAQRDVRVEALLSLGMTVTLSNKGALPGAHLTRATLDSRRRGYYKKLLQPGAWARLLTFKSDYSVIWAAMKRLVVPGRPTPPASSTDKQQLGNANPLFPAAYLEFLGRGGRVLMLFSEKDRTLSEYVEKFEEPFARQVQPFAAQIHKHVVPNANHVMSLPEWQREMVDVSRSWLSRLHGV